MSCHRPTKGAAQRTTEWWSVCSRRGVISVVITDPPQSQWPNRHTAAGTCVDCTSICEQATPTEAPKASSRFRHLPGFGGGLELEYAVLGSHTERVVQEGRKHVNWPGRVAGIYIKAAQFVASLQGGAGDHGIPKEYVRVLQVRSLPIEQLGGARERRGGV